MKKFITFLCCILALSSCQKINLDEQIPEGKYKITFNFNQETRSVVNLTDEVSRISWKLFYKVGNDWKYYTVVNQIKDIDEDFGIYEKLVNDGGIYKLVCIGYDGEGNCTISDSSKVTFKSSHIYNTYCYVSPEFLVNTNITIPISPRRCVSKIKIYPNDSLKMDGYGAEFLKFAYTGGSSTLNPSIGFGTVNSKQTITLNKSEFKCHDNESIPSFEIYTFPHTEEDILTKITINSLDVNENVIDENIIENIPIQKNAITKINCNLFSKNKASTSDIKVDNSWNTNITNITF